MSFQWLRKSKKLHASTAFSPVGNLFRNSFRIHGMFATHLKPWSFKHLRRVSIRQLNPVPDAEPFMKLRPFHSTSTRVPAKLLWRVIRTCVLSNMFGAARPVVGASRSAGRSRPKNVQCGFCDQQPRRSHLWHPCLRCNSQH